MLNNTRRVLIALSLSALMLACSSGKDDGKAKPAAEPKAAEPAPAAAGTPAPAETGRKMMMSDNPARDQANAAADQAEGEAAAPPSGVVPKVEKLAEKACGCKDKKCAGGVQDELATLMGEMKDVQANERQTIATAMQKLQKCLADAQQ